MKLSKFLLTIGWPAGPSFHSALEVDREEEFYRNLMAVAKGELSNEALSIPEEALLKELLKDIRYHEKPVLKNLLQSPIPYEVFGEDLIHENAISQMNAACRLEVAVAGALMPDAHVGYGLPIGGVLALDNHVSPYAVGVDIACRMRLTILEEKEYDEKNVVDALMKRTRFGAGREFQKRHDHAVMDSPLWNANPFLQSLKDKAWAQLGTSGGGNHFVDIGMLEEVAINGRKSLAIMSHSGSRGLGKAICDKYSAIAKQVCSLPEQVKHLAYLDLDEEEGDAYWTAMTLAGEYAAANHLLIHQSLVKELGWTAIESHENHHNFAWKETVNGKEAVVHRKGATPAGDGVMGIIPGSRETSGFLVRGKGNALSLNSASHGSGRALSRRNAIQTLDPNSVTEKSRNITLIGSAADESSLAYKDIHEVIAAQADLVEVLAEFTPMVVRMASDGYVED